MSGLGQLSDADLLQLVNPVNAQTGAALPPSQANTYRQLSAAGGIDPKAPGGSPRLPLAQTEQGVEPPAGQYYVTLDGKVVRSGGQAPLQHLTAQQITDALANVNPQMSALEDVGRSGVTGVEKGVTGTVGIGGNLENAYGNGLLSLAHSVGGALHLYSPEQLAAQAADPTINFAKLNHTLSSSDLDPGMQRLFGAYHTPQTTPGKYAETIGSFAPAALAGPEGLFSRAASVVLPGALSETAGEAAHPYGPGWESAARLAGGLGGGLGVNMMENVARGPQIAASKYLSGYTPEQISDATGFMARQQAQNGLSITPLEALGQRSGGSAPVLQHYVENSAAGRPLTQPFFDQRPGQVRDAVQQMADLISPERPGGAALLGADSQHGASNAIRSVRQAINLEAQPMYDALVHQEMPLDAYQALAQNPSYTRALGDFRGQPEIAHTYADLPDNNLAVVNEAQKQLDANILAGRRQDPNPSGNLQLEAARMQARSLADIQARSASELAYGGEYGRARDIVSQGRTERLDPLQAGPLGMMQTTPHLSTQTTALYPTQPNVGGVPDLVLALNHLGPELGGALTRQHLLDTADTSMRDLQSGENQWGGAGLAKRLAGSDEQYNRLIAGVHAMSGNETAQQMADLIDGLQATGKRMPTGSQTAFNSERAAQMGVTPTPVRTLLHALDPLEWGASMDKALGGAMYRRNISSLADMLTNMSPEDAGAFLQGSAHQNLGAGQITRLLVDANRSQGQQ